LFGAASSAAPSSAGAFSFSLSASASSAAAPAASAFGSIFSNPASAVPAAAGGGFFGQQQQQQQQQGASNIFGALTVPGQQQQQGAAGTQLSPLSYSSTSHEAVKRELEGIATAYMPNHSSYRFQHIFLNVLDNPAQKVKPQFVVDELSWKQAMRDAGGPDNPDK
jgi:nuclear pore complex protein Nup54